MVFGAGLVLIFAGLALVLPGRIPVGQKEITAKAARWAGGILLLFLPMAIVMHFLWKRNDWGRDTPLVNAQWGAFGSLVFTSLCVILWSLYVRAQPSTKPRVAIEKESAFEEVPDDPTDEPSAEPEPEPEPPPPMPAPRTKKKPSGGTPFDF